jgi:hypothetical protein
MIVNLFMFFHIKVENFNELIGKRYTSLMFVKSDLRLFGSLTISYCYVNLRANNPTAIIMINMKVIWLYSIQGVFLEAA